MHEGDPTNNLPGIVRTFPYWPGMPGMDSGLPDLMRHSGACDPQFRDTPARLVPFRFFTGFVRYVLAAGNYTLAQNAPLTLFNAGPGEIGAGNASSGAVNALTQSDTNTLNSGGTVGQGRRWITVGISCQFREPYLTAAGANANPAALVYDPSLRGPAGNAAPCLRHAADNVSWIITSAQENACRYNVGPASSWGDTGSASQLQLSPGGVPGQSYYLSTPHGSGGVNDPDAMQVLGNCDYGATVIPDAGNPAPAAQDLIVPVRFYLIGIPLCPAGVASDLRELIRQAAEDPVMRENLRKILQG